MNRNNISISAILAMAFCLSSFFSPSAQALEPHENIQGLFNTTRDVVIKCLECHKQKAAEVLQSTHWTWKRAHMVNGQQIMYGKKDSLAGFAIDIASNPSHCLRCHISSTLDIGVFEKAGEADVDCLVCHDTTGKYTRNKNEKGLEQTDFETIARNVGKPSPENCTTCHFAECGLTESSRQDPDDKKKKYSTRNDVHMAGEFASFTCQECHLKSSGHSFSRAIVHGSDLISQGERCASCHTASPHLLDSLNRHTGSVSCRTCHIPEYATKTTAIISWNWLLSGKIKPTIQSISGSESLLQDSNGFTSSKMIRPVYMWDDGGDLVYSRGQRIRPQELTYLQRPGERTRNSKIAPFMVLYGTQLYDAKYRYLISPLLSTGGEELFPGPDWDTIAREGMKAIVLPYSGQYGVAPTASLRRLNHGVAPARDALDCTDCHGSNSRMNWQFLGYDQDPWSADEAGQPGAGPLQGNRITQKVQPPAPVQEMQILPTPVF
jgi:octaheme c-type cytochrome (tetrathionate reductase family)